MKTKTLSPEKAEKKLLKKQREIAKWEREKARPKNNYYLVYLVFIITLIYIVDEIASQIGPLMKTEIANDLFARYGDRSIGIADLIALIAIPFQALSILYKPLADRFGRKIFLVVNTLGMGLGMLCIFLSQNVILYVVGSCLIQFFVPHDMQVVYIMESAPSKHRGRIYSVVKCIASVCVMLVPLMRKLLMTDTSKWRMVYLIPAVLGLSISFVALLLARETDAFIDSRIRYLKLSEEEIRAQKEKHDGQNSQGNFFSALLFAFKHRQLRNLFICALIFSAGFVITMHYQVILSYGYASHDLSAGLFSSLDAALEGVAVSQVTKALFLFPVGSALAQLLVGFVADHFSRKHAAVTMTALCIAFFVAFSVGASLGWTPYLVGFFTGASIGSYWGVGDINIFMVSESAPTNLRSAVLSAQLLFTGTGTVLNYIIIVPLINKFGNSITGPAAFVIAVVGMSISLVFLASKVHDTTGVDLEKVTGCEWD